MKLIFYTLLLLSLFSCQPKDLPTQLKADPDNSYLKVSHLTTNDELVKAKDDLKQVGISLNFDKSTFFENGNLRTLNLMVTLANGTGGKCTADLSKLQYTYYGFEFNKNNGNTLQTGSIN
jgi:hypothetical protein